MRSRLEFLGLQRNFQVEGMLWCQVPKAKTMMKLQSPWDAKQNCFRDLPAQLEQGGVRMTSLVLLFYYKVSVTFLVKNVFY